MPPKPKRPKVVQLADYQPISQPSVRSATLWTPAHLRGMQAQADGGDMSRLSDLCEQMMADDRIGELLESLASDVLGCDLTFEKSARSTLGDAEKARELEEDWTHGYDDDEITSIAIWTLMAGLGFAKHEVWVENEGRIVPKLKSWHLRQFAYSAPTSSNDRWARQWHVKDHDGYATPIQPGDGTWVMLTRRGEFRPWANGLWRGLAPWWLLKQYAISDWGVHSEKASKVVVTAADGATSDQRKAISKYVYEASKDAVISLPVGFDMKLIELSANTKEIYEAQIEAANKGFSIAIQGQNLTSDVQSGSRAAAEVHERKEGRKSRYLAKVLSKGLREQSLSWWAEYNFGDRNLAPYPHWHTEPPEDYSSRAQGLQTLADALGKLKTAGYKLSVDQLEEEYGVALEEVQEPGPEPEAGAEAEEPADDEFEDEGEEDDEFDVAANAPRFLASGDDASDAKGFVRGQVYVDTLTDKQTALAADSLSAFVDRLAQAVEGAEDYEQVRYAVIKAFSAESDPDRLVELIEHGILLANLAGRNAVQEDAPEDAVSAIFGLSLEAARARYPAGSPKGGQFKPKGAGNPGVSPGKKTVGKKSSGGGGPGGGGGPAPQKASPSKKAVPARPAAKTRKKLTPEQKRKAAEQKATATARRELAIKAKARAKIAARLEKKQQRKQATEAKKAAAAIAAKKVAKPRKKTGAAKATHTVEHHEKALKEQYGESARTVAWGRAMHERGRDMPLSDLHASIDHLKASGVAHFDHRENLAAKEILAKGKVKTAGQLAAAMHKQGVQANSTPLKDMAVEISITAKLAAHHQALEGSRAGKLDFKSPVSHDKRASITAKEAQEVRDRAAGVYGALSHKDIQHPVGNNWVANGAERGTFVPMTGVVNIGAGRAHADHTSVALHEWGHAIEHANPSRQQKAVSYLEARTKGESIRPLSEITGNRAYGPRERAQPDKLFSAYMGKVYEGNGRGSYKGRAATEVTSMSVQYLHNMSQLRPVHVKDPDTLNFALGQLANQ